MSNKHCPICGKLLVYTFSYHGVEYWNCEKKINAFYEYMFVCNNISLLYERYIINEICIEYNIDNDIDNVYVRRFTSFEVIAKFNKSILNDKEKFISKIDKLMVFV